jgi:predicted amidohydrolase YtcJ
MRERTAAILSQETFLLRGVVLPLTERDAQDGEWLVIRGQYLDRDPGRGAVPPEEVDRPCIDFGRRPILPGFVDPHTHAEVACLSNDLVDCRVPRNRSVSDVLDTLSDGAAKALPENWLIAQANLFFDQKLKERRFPSREELDSVSSEIPIAILAGGHLTILNSAGVERSRLERYRTGMPGVLGRAVVATDAEGKATGVVSELEGVLPLPMPVGEELMSCIRRGIHELFTAHGVTTIGEMPRSLEGLQCFDTLLTDKQIAIRVCPYIMVPAVLPLAEACRYASDPGFASPAAWMDVRGVKMFADGGYSSRNAATLTPYLAEYAVPGCPCGQLNLDHTALGEAIRNTRDAGLQLAVHVNGERAQAELAEAAIRSTGAGNAGPQIRAEHAGNVVTSGDTVERLRRSGLLPVPQPVFLYNFGAFLPTYLGEPLTSGRFPFRTLLHDSWHISGSSDVFWGSEEGQSNPFLGVWCSVARRDFWGELLEPAEAVTVTEALRMHTLYAAEALGVQSTRGSLEAGKLADLVVLDTDPREIPADELRNVKVDYVFVDGKLAYERQGAERPIVHA